MRKYKFLGYTKQAVEYVFEVNGEKVVISSNAARYEDAITAAELPESARLIQSLSFPIYDGKKNKDPYTTEIWAYRGSLPSGKAAVEYLIEKGVLTEKQAAAIHGAPEIRL